MRREWAVAALALTIAAPAAGEMSYTSAGITIASTTSGAPQDLPAVLMKPDGAGPFPAVVILHDCSGLGARSSGAPGRWGRALARQGYVIVIPDSFSPRGLPDGICTASLTPPDFARVGPDARSIDAYATLAHARQLDYVDTRHDGVMGTSHGGSSTLAAIVESTATPELIELKRDGFAAAIALYPACGSRYGGWDVLRKRGMRGPVIDYRGVFKPIAPLLILIGEKDDWTPAGDCTALAARAQQVGYPVAIVVYPGALHAFDNSAPVRYVQQRNNINMPDGKGATTGGDDAAWRDSIERVTTFFGEHLAHAVDR